MPWRGPEVPGEFPTLGYAVADWIQARCVVPDGDHVGEPYVLTDEMVRFLLNLYRLDPETGRFVAFRGGQLIRPQKWGKGPFSASLICVESAPDGPVLFDGWDAAGEPVGRPWATPWVQVTAVSEDQTDNVWRALQPMIELGALAAEIPDTGVTRINLPSGGVIEPVTSSARSRLGQRITFAVQDETHSWTQRNGGRALADNQRRNLAGTGGRWIETTNAWDPAETSVAQQTFEDVSSDGVFRDMAQPGAGSVANKQDRRRMIRRVYGDSWWVDRDRIDAEIASLLERDPAQAERFFLNRPTAGAGAAFDADRFAELATDHEPQPGEVVVVGVDGARFRDALAVVATEVRTGHQWLAGIWERPEHAPDGYEHPTSEVDGVVQDLFDRFDVWRLYADPQWIEHLVHDWQGRYGDRRVVEWYMNRPRQTAHAIRAWTEAVGAGDLTHDGHPRLVAHVRNARRQPVNVRDDRGRPMHVIAKAHSESPLKIDAAAAAVISWEARGDCIAAGVPVTATVQRNRVVSF
jgi:hypothetical protein